MEGYEWIRDARRFGRDQGHDAFKRLSRKSGEDKAKRCGPRKQRSE
jgi:hypothetical protein